MSVPERCLEEEIPPTPEWVEIWQASVDEYCNYAYDCVPVDIDDAISDFTATVEGLQTAIRELKGEREKTAPYDPSDRLRDAMMDMEWGL